MLVHVALKVMKVCLTCVSKCSDSFNSCSLDERQPVQATSIPDHLTQMIELLSQEDEENDGTTVCTSGCNLLYNTCIAISATHLNACIINLVWGMHASHFFCDMNTTMHYKT